MISSDDDSEPFFDALGEDEQHALNGGRRKSSLHPLSDLATPYAHSNDSIVGGGDTASFTLDIEDEPAKIRTTPKNKSAPQFFTSLHLVQELQVHMGAVYAARFSRDGHYLAAAGQDRSVYIWTLRVRRQLREENLQHRPMAIFEPDPTVLAGHEGDILDLCWSRPENNFLLTASMDKSVRLWHPEKATCLAVFRHADFVTSVAFNPRDDRYFVSGSLDRKCRLWSLDMNKVLSMYELGPASLITACAYNANGTVLVGTSNALCIFLHVSDGHQLTYTGQASTCSRRGKNRLGSKISGIDTHSDLVENGLHL